MQINMPQNYDLLIIGAGPIGLACGIEAQKVGLSYLIVEKGCLVNSLYNYPSNMTFFSTSDLLEIGEVPFVSNQAKPSRGEALEYYRRVAISKKLAIHIFEKVENVTNTDAGFEVTTTKTVYCAKSVVLATGFFDIPYTIGVPGENLPKVSHYYKDPHYYAFQDVAVIGSNNSAVDAALECWRKGANVTMVVRSSQIGERVKYWARPDIVNRIAEGSIKAYFDSEVIEILDYEIVVKTPAGIVRLPNHWVLAMTGYQPDMAFLQKIGINLSADAQQKPEINEATMQSNVPGLYLAGVICGGMDTHSLFIENSRIHAQRIVNHILLKNKQS
jgi:thioredoxin reductase (NADPH)